MNGLYSKFSTICDVLLRVPSLFYVELFYSRNNDTTALNFKIISRNIIDALDILIFKADTSSYQSLDHSILYTTETIINVIVLFCIFLIAFLPTSRVVQLYTYIICAALIYLAAASSREFLFKVNPWLSLETGHHHTRTPFVRGSPSTPDPVFSPSAIGALCLANLVLHAVVSSTVVYLLSLTWEARTILSVFSLPVLLYVCHLPLTFLPLVHNSAVIFILLSATFYFIKHFNSLCHALHNLYYEIRYIDRNNGIMEVPLQLWTRYNISLQLLYFWSIMFLIDLCRFWNKKESLTLITEEGGQLMDSWIGSPYIILVLHCISESCSTPIGMVALCITVSYASCAVLSVTKLYLLGRPGLLIDNVLHRGWAEGITMLLIALQVDLLGMSPVYRTNLMVIVLFIIVNSLLESMHDIVGPHLLQLGASQSATKSTHINALSISIFLFILPIYMTYFIYYMFTTDFWLLIILSSSLLTALQVISTLLIYVLFICDRLRSEPYSNLDDIVFYIHSTMRLLEFTVAVIVVSFGFKESVFGQWNIFGAGVLAVHFYFNVWQRLQSGWSSYMLRRQAMQRMQTLPCATATELVQWNDVCPICFGEMSASTSTSSGLLPRRTVCNHFFHSICLRKWLNVKDTCPMCQQKIAEEALEVPGVSGTNQNAAALPDVPDGGVDEVGSEVDSDLAEDNETDVWSVVTTSSESSLYDDEDVDLSVYWNHEEIIRRERSAARRSRAAAGDEEEYDSDDD